MLTSFTTANWQMGLFCHLLHPSPLKTQHSVLQKTGTQTLPVFRYSTVTSLLYQLPSSCYCSSYNILHQLLQFVKMPYTTIKVPQNVSIFYQANMLYIVCFISGALVINFQHTVFQLNLNHGTNNKSSQKNSTCKNVCSNPTRVEKSLLAHPQ